MALRQPRERWMGDAERDHAGERLWVGLGFIWSLASHLRASPVIWATLLSLADIFDSAVVRCTNGATISVQGVAALPFKSYTESTKQIDNKIFGTEGMLTYSGEDMHPDSGALILKRHDGKDQRFEGFYFENYSADGYGPESLKAFIDSCLGKPVFNGADAIVGLKAVQTIDAMYRSAKSGQPESVV
ncbi:unnamed protein product [Polarella glacialis]|uniref:Gfo/Idh/MocA-like oxidoreductase C-terminal domain-containing protein n=1 Tax=Polarella glacialis TaxID=89957 RepID=A0A813D5R8_POLGL|nr:unnamed protein product [Polarella glacialis]